MRSARPGRAAAAALLGLAFALFYLAIGRGALVFGDDVLMYQVTAAMRERGEVRVSAPLSDASPVRPVPGRDGGRYAKYGIGLSLVAIPFDAAGEWLEGRGFRLPEAQDAAGNLRTGARIWAVHLTSAAIGGATVAALFLLASAFGYSRGVAAATAAAFGGATVFAHSATTFLSEPLSALAITVALFALVRARTDAEPAGGPWTGWLALSGCAAGLAFATRAANLVVVLPLAAVLAWELARSTAPDRRRLLAALAWGVPFAGWAGAVAAYNFQRFGSVFETGYGAEAGQFSQPLLAGLAGLLVSPGRGLLWFAPPVVLAVWGWRGFLNRGKAMAWLALAMAAALLLLAAKFYQWHGGGVWGPRLLVPVLPLLLLPAAEVFHRAAAGSARHRWAAAACLAAGVFGVALAVLVPFERAVQEVWKRPADLDSPAFRASLWSPPASPLVVHARALPGAVRRTARLLAGREALPGPAEKGSAGLPDLAFARYGSHALLEVTRLAMLAAAGLAGLLMWQLRAGGRAD